MTGRGHRAKGTGVRVALALVILALAPPAFAQVDLAGVWAPYRGGRGSDPALAPPPATAIVLKPQYAAPFDAKRKAEADAAAKGEPIASGAVSCTPYGMPRMMQVALYPIEILPTKGQITIVAEAFSEVRRIYMDVPQTPIDDVPPGFYGRSVGRWDGATLVVDTVGIKTTVPSYQNMPHSDRIHITERLRLVTHDILHDQITIDDPVVLEKPFTYTLAYRRMPGYEMVEFVCDNNREYIDEKGGTHLRVRDR
jgi:hypothetical protein